MKRILVVDDSMTLRRQVKSALLGAGYDVIEAGDGQEALDQLAAHKDVQFVVCDVSMPRMSGIEFLETLRVRGSTVDVVMLTTEAQPDLVARAKRLGARGWLTKPLQRDLLLSLVRHVLASSSSGGISP